MAQGDSLSAAVQAEPERDQEFPTPSNDSAATETGDQATESERETSSDGVTDAPAPNSSPITRDRVQAKLDALRDAPDLDEEARTELSKRYKAALDWLVLADDSQVKANQYEAEASNVPKQMADAKLKLAETMPEVSLQVPDGTPLPQMEQQLTEAENRLASATDLLSKREEEIKRRGDRKAELVRLLEESKQRQDDAQQQLTAGPAPNESPALAEARAAELAARMHALGAQQLLYRAEAKRLEVLAELFPLQRDIAKRNRTQREKEANAWRDMVTLQRKQESERQAREALRQVQLARPAVRELAERNATLAEDRKRLSEALTVISDEVQVTDKLCEKVRDSFAGAKEKVDKAGHSSTVGLILRKEEEDLVDLRQCVLRLRFVATEMPRANLERIQCEDERTDMGDIEVAVAQFMCRFSPAELSTNATSMEQTVRELLTTKRELLDKIAIDSDSYLQKLSELEISHRNLMEETRQFETYIHEHVLWIRSSGFVQTSDFTKAAEGILSLLQPHPWIQLIRASGLDALRRPFVAIFTLIGVLIVLYGNVWLRSQVRQLCETKTSSHMLRIRPTLAALALTIAISAQWPMVLCAAGWWLSQMEQTSELGLALGSVLFYTAALWWCAAFVRQICRVGGVAETHFGWSASSLAIVRREVLYLLLLGVPLAAVCAISETYYQGEWSESLGRLAFVGVMLMLASAVRTMFGGSNNIFRLQIAKDSTGWISRLRVSLLTTGILFPGILTACALAGYYYSAQQLAIRLQYTLGLVLGVLVVHAAISRWLQVRRRYMAMQQAREKQLNADNQNDTNTSQMGNVGVRTQDQPDWSEVHSQMRVLLRQAVAITVFVGGCLIWADVLPALRVLDQVQLWETTVEVTEHHEDAQGNDSTKMVARSEPTTLRHIVLAAAMLIATVVIGRNLPALLQMTILNRLPLDRGGRHAFAVIVRYAVALTGLLWACRTVRMDWGSVQWLAAGMTVGLGFGLQEIFANFISGMILLFERPIRVGDVITLDDITGTVTDIRIRATTVTNWDRKELIVPNKELITGRLLNWTLTDTTNRIVIPVGVSYDTDPDAAQEILLSTVAAHPNVLEDPKPSVVFENFGESTLDFVARAYLASLEVRLATIHELHVTILRRFRQAGIEIAFPQRDINVRGLDRLMTLASAQHGHKTRAA